MIIRHQNKRLSATALFLCALISSAVFAAEKVGKPALTVRTTQLKAENWSKSLSANGSILPWQEAVVGAEIAALRIVAINVNIGDSVKKGDVLATLDTASLQANVAELRASLLESEAVLADAQANVERSKKLIAAGFVSDQQSSQTSTAAQTAQARVAVQKARLDASLVRLAQAQIVAPDDGVISASSVAVGSLTQNNTELFRLIRKGRLEWFAEMTAEELVQIKKGMAVEVSIAPGKVLRGKVRAVSPSVNSQTRHGQVIVSFTDQINLVGGLFVRGVFDISGGSKPVQTLPLAALMQRGSQNFVLVVGADQHVHERMVSVGQRNGERVEIKQGLQQNESVVESGGAFLTEGDIVQVVKG